MHKKVNILCLWIVAWCLTIDHEGKPARVIFFAKSQQQSRESNVGIKKYKKNCLKETDNKFIKFFIQMKKKCDVFWMDMVNRPKNPPKGRMGCVSYLAGKS